MIHSTIVFVVGAQIKEGGMNSATTQGIVDREILVKFPSEKREVVDVVDGYGRWSALIANTWSRLESGDLHHLRSRQRATTEVGVLHV